MAVIGKMPQALGKLWLLFQHGARRHFSSG
ncbi:hypothetical protein ACP0HM_06270 [Escherichia coli]